MASLTKAQRSKLHGMYGGRCAYCGEVLTKTWQADHKEPVGRQGKWVFGKYMQTGAMDWPERDCIENLVPACRPCNIHKSVYSLEEWRRILQNSGEVLTRNYATYKHAKRFGLVVELKPTVVFFFERPRRRIFNVQD